MTTQPIEPERFRHVFATVPTAVSVVTTGPAAERHGATIGSFGALSLEPPLLMCAFKRSSAMLSRLQRGVHFGINVLAAGQAEIAATFATPEEDRFRDTAWYEDQGLPRIDGIAAWLTAIVQDRVPFGDHVLVSGLITRAERDAAQPLIHVNRSYTSAAEGRRPLAETAS